MRVIELVASTDHAALATDGEGGLLAINEAAARLLGHTEAEALETRCYDLLQGTDRFGNRFCHQTCAVADMARRREPVRDFELCIRHASGGCVLASISVVVLHGTGPSGIALVHLIKPVDREARRATRTSDPTFGGGLRPPGAGAAGAAHLTPRETEVLSLLLEGKSTAAMADELCNSVGTVRNHVKNILKKLGVHSRLEAITLCWRRGWFGHDD